MSSELLKEVLDYFDKDTTNVPMNLYKKVFNHLYPPTPKQDSREWEILSVAKGANWSCDKKTLDWHLKNGWEINQVKRLSDNSIWTIGEVVGTKHFSKDTIERLWVDGNEMYVRFMDSPSCSLCWLTKHPSTHTPKEEAKPLSDRIKVGGMYENHRYPKGAIQYAFDMEQKIPDGKKHLIKQAIEQVLNNPNT